MANHCVEIKCPKCGFEYCLRCSWGKCPKCGDKYYPKDVFLEKKTPKLVRAFEQRPNYIIVDDLK